MNMMYVYLAAGLAISGVTAYITHTVDAAVYTTAKEKALSELVESMQASCDAAKKVTEESSHEYQNQLDSTRKQLADAKRVRRCVVPVSGPADGFDGTAWAKLDQRYAVDTDALFDVAGTGEQYRQQVIGLQRFVLRERGIDPDKFYATKP